jgi:hypothetical protein
VTDAKADSLKNGGKTCIRALSLKSGDVKIVHMRKINFLEINSLLQNCSTEFQAAYLITS